MGVISPYKTFTFDSKSSADYGVYLTGEGVFNAPERSVEMVEIPGRNGNFALDKGRFENISVTYRVGMFDDDEENFANKVSAFRNWLCSKVGYVRLSDDYNPNEYRLAVYLSGLELEHDFLIAGEAQITFDCKPQRWLTSGETAVSVADGGTLDNPTLFDASPLLEVKGYGNIDIGGQDIEIASVPIGDVTVADTKSIVFNSPSKPIPFNAINIDISNVPTNNGDEITINEVALSSDWSCGSDKTLSNESASIVSGDVSNVHASIVGGQTITMYLSVKPQTPFYYGTSATKTAQVSVSVDVSSLGTKTRTITLSIAYDGADTLTITYTETSATGLYNIGYTAGQARGIIVNSTVSALGNPMYIDLDIGECWNEDSGVPVSVNNAVTLPSDLPVLPPGSTTFTYDNTITSFKVKPRWWKI